jgi:hypothetical protein
MMDENVPDEERIVARKEKMKRPRHGEGTQ